MNFTEQLRTKFGGFIMYLCSTTDQYVVICMHVIVYLRQQRGEGALEQKSMFHTHILHPERGSTFLLHKCSELQCTD